MSEAFVRFYFAIEKNFLQDQLYDVGRKRQYETVFEIYYARKLSFYVRIQLLLR